MARPRKRDQAEALNAAMELFWTTGFCPLGTREIEEKTGITRFSLQTTFGGKKALFLAALDQYLELFETHAAPPTDADDLSALAQWFETQGAPEHFPAIAAQGCLMVNSIVEFAGSDAEVAERTDRFLDLLRNRFCAALDRASQAGALSPKIDTTGAAEHLTGTTVGMMVMIRAGGSRNACAPVAKATADQIRLWQV